jgi:kinesin family protein 1
MTGGIHTIEHVVNVHFVVSYLEIYMEKVKDLLDTSSLALGDPAPHLRVREHPTTGPFVEGARIEAVKTYADVRKLMQRGSARRRTAATDMNEYSSRSHAIFVLTMTQERSLPDGNKYSVVSKVNLVDLAGSENARQAGTTGERLKEGASINKSLLTLGRVIKTLADRARSKAATETLHRGPRGSGSTPFKKPPQDIKRRGSAIGIGAEEAKFHSIQQPAGSFDHEDGNRRVSDGASSAMAPPYRDSVLTYLLKDSLGGNSKTSLVATIRPGLTYAEETAITLAYASQARTIVNIVHVNENPFVATIKAVSTVKYVV